MQPEILNQLTWYDIYKICQAVAEVSAKIPQENVDELIARVSRKEDVYHLALNRLKQKAK